MTQIDYNRAAKYFLLQDVWQGFKLGMKYFFAPKAMRIGWMALLPMSLAWVVIVSFLAKYEVLGGFWARWAVGG